MEKIYTKNNPLRITSLEDLKLKNFGNTFMRRNYAVYYCEKCNKESKTRMFTLIQNNKLVCHVCMIEKSVINKYGSKENFLKCKSEASKKTCQEKYGVDNVFQLDSVKKKIKANIAKNDPDYRKRVEKAKNTCLDRYGVTNGGASKQALEKIMKTKKEKYNDSFYTNRQKSAKTFKSHYNTPESKQELKEKRIQGRINNYGTKENYINTMLEHQRKTCQEKYGVEYYSQYPGRQIKGFSRFKYYYDDYVFDSSWELAYYIWLKDQNVEFTVHPFPIDYYDEEKQKYRKYFPDFIVADEYIEIKGDFLMEGNNLKDKGKQKVIEEYEVGLITKEEIKPYLEYAKAKVGDLNQFRKKKSFTKV